MAGEARGCAFPKVYSVIAHGCDIVSEDRHVIPEGCAYVTVELCGHISYVYEKIMFAMLDLTVRPQLKDPCANIELLKEYFGERDLKIRNAGESYTDAEFSGFLDMTDYNQRIYKSGLYEIESFRPVLGDDGNFTDKFYLDKAPRAVISEDDYNKIYFGSILETRTPFVEGMTIEHYTRTNYRWRLSSAFLIYPGVYYNFVCRLPCDPVGARDRILTRVAKVRRASNPAVGVMNADTIVNRPRFGNTLQRSYFKRLSQGARFSIHDVNAWILKQVTRVLPLFYDDRNPPGVRIHDRLKGTAFHAYINAFLHGNYPARFPSLALTPEDIAALGPIGEPAAGNTSPRLNNSRYPVEDRVGFVTSQLSANLSIYIIKEAIKRLIYYLHNRIFPDFLLKKAITEVEPKSKLAKAMYELITEGLWSPEVKRQIEQARTGPNQTYESMSDQRHDLSEALNGLLQHTLVAWVDECIFRGEVAAPPLRHDNPRPPNVGAQPVGAPLPGGAPLPLRAPPLGAPPLPRGAPPLGAPPPAPRAARGDNFSSVGEWQPSHWGFGGSTRKSKRRLRKSRKNKTRHLK